MNFLYVTFVVIVYYCASFVEGRCEDRLVACPAFADNCHIILIKRNCQRTCDACGTDLCTVDNGGCEQLCEWDGEDVHCSCEVGFRLDSRDQSSCIDVDECTEGPNPCFPFDTFYCLNTVGSFTCQLSDCFTNSNQTQMNYYRSEGCCNLENSVCGITQNIRQYLANDVDHRVVNGQVSQIGQWPWQAQLIFQHSAHCGATLISEKWLVGAAHCFAKTSYTQMFVYLGHVRNALTGTMQSDRREQRRIVNVILHEGYDNYTNDIALIELDRPIRFNSSISPLCLPCGEYPAVGDKCWVTGFGKTIDDDDESIPEFLQEADVPIIDGDECRRAYEDDFPIDTEAMLCAGYQQGGKDTCLGDSGGPLACQRSDSCEWYLAGVTSFGRGCGLPDSYGIYVNVINYESWIRENLGDDAPPPCKRMYNPCRGLTNIDGDCYQKLGLCTDFPHYMGVHCNQACCQLANDEIRNCFDFEGATPFCESQKALGGCTDPLMQQFVRTFCQFTCDFC